MRCGAPGFFEKMDEMLGYPSVDPHGSPIPGRFGKVERKKFIKLSSCRPGDVVKLSAVLGSSADFLKYLNSRDLRLGLKIKVKFLEPFNGNMTVSYNKRTAEVFSHAVCERLLVID